MKKWSQIKTETMSPERIKRSRAAAERELLVFTLRELRDRVGLSQVETAELAETTQSTVSKLERGEQMPSLEQLRAYVRALGGELEVVAVLGNERITLTGV